MIKIATRYRFCEHYSGCCNFQRIPESWHHPEIPVPTWKYPDQGSKMGGFKIISGNLSNKSNTNSHSGIPNWKIISTNLSNKSNSNYFGQIRKVIKIASRHHETARTKSNVRWNHYEKIKTEISRQPEIVSAKNRAGMRRRGSLF